MKFSPWRWLFLSLVLVGCAFLVFVACVSSGDPHPHLSEAAKESARRLEIMAPVMDEHRPICEIAGIRYRMAMDQIVVVDEEGSEIDLVLEPRATRSSLVDRGKTLAAGRKWYPVLLPEEKENDKAARRLVTSEITIQIPAGSTAQQVAKDTGLELKSVPSYAPGLAIFSAPDPVQALEISQRLQVTGAYSLVEIQLAKQQNKRSLPNDPLLGSQWHLKFQNQANVVAGTDVNIENAWRYGESGGVRGAGIRVGIIDDGLQTGHPDFVGNIDTDIDKDWNSNDNDPNPGGSNHHGTSCAGNVAARGNNNLGVCGTAPEATLVGLRLTAASTTDLMESEAMAYRNDVILIKSNSWGPSDNGYTLDEPGALTKAAFVTATTSGRNNRGTIFLWAAGNGGYTEDQNDNSNYDGYANSIYTIAVGAFDSKSRRSEYSERGSNVVIVAPSDGATDAAGITTVDRTGTSGYNKLGGAAGDYANDFGGTSSATPTAAGIIALMLEKNPNLGWRDVQEILIRSAKKVNPNESGWVDNAAGYHFNHNYGAGLIDAAKAVEVAGPWINRPARLAPVISSHSNLALAIPDDDPIGVTHSFAIESNIRVEHVTVKVSITHGYRGDLAISLISPSGMVSQLSEAHGDDGSNYANWTFSTVRHWGEMSVGTWTLKIVDEGAADAGTLTSAELSIFGTAAFTPSVAITSPNDNSSLGMEQPVTILVSAVGNTARCELRENGIVIASDTEAPYSFDVLPSTSAPTYTAVAYDTDNIFSQSNAVTLSILSPYQQWINGFPNLTNTSASADPDGDGFSNEQEFAAKTNPGDAASALKILSFSHDLATAQVTMTWQSIEGVSYQLQQSENLSAWSDVGAIVPATGASTSLTFSITPASKQFFRIRTAP